MLLALYCRFWRRDDFSLDGTGVLDFLGSVEGRVGGLWDLVLWQGGVGCGGMASRTLEVRAGAWVDDGCKINYTEDGAKRYAYA